MNNVILTLHLNFRIHRSIYERGFKNKYTPMDIHRTLDSIVTVDVVKRAPIVQVLKKLNTHTYIKKVV